MVLSFIQQQGFDACFNANFKRLYKKNILFCVSDVRQASDLDTVEADPESALGPQVHQGTGNKKRIVYFST